MTQAVEFPGNPECCNGIDDNGDGAIDEFVCACQTTADCANIGNYDAACYADYTGTCGYDCRRFGGDLLCEMIGPGYTCQRNGPYVGSCSQEVSFP